MKKICFITTTSITLRSFVVPFAEYIHMHSNWKVFFVCDYDKELQKDLPEYINYIPVKMKRGVGVDGVRAILSMSKLFRMERFDIVQYSTPNAALYASIAGWLAGVQARLYCQWGMAFVGFSGWKRFLFKKLEKVICRLSTRIEPDSFSNLQFAIAEGLYTKEKSKVVGYGSACGVDFSKFDIEKKEVYRKEGRAKHQIGDNTFVYGFVGRITRDKGVNELLASFKHVLQKKDSLLFMIGDSEVDHTVNSRLYQWSLECKKVIYIGYTKEVEKYLSIIDCYVLPSYREGFGLGVIEAEAMKTPVIVTDIPGPRDSVTDKSTGIIVRPRDTRSLYHGMMQMLSDQVGRERFVENGYRFVKERFDREKLFCLMIEDRREILATQGNNHR